MTALQRETGSDNWVIELSADEPSELMKKRLAWMIDMAVGATSLQQFEELLARDDVVALARCLPLRLRVRWASAIASIHIAFGSME